MATDIVIGDLTIMTVTNDDAKAIGKPRSALAEDYVRIIRTASEAQGQEYGVRTILFDAS